LLRQPARGHNQDGRFLYEPPDSFVDLPATSGDGAVVTASAEVGLLAPLGPAAVTLADQRTDGEEVVVGEVTLPAPGFVALQAEVDGVPGVVLGLSGLLPEGTTSAVAIPLGEPAPGVQTIFAVAYVDRDGDRWPASPMQAPDRWQSLRRRPAASADRWCSLPRGSVEDQEGHAVVVASGDLPPTVEVRRLGRLLAEAGDEQRCRRRPPLEQAAEPGGRRRAVGPVRTISTVTGTSARGSAFDAPGSR
jgi:hypothetical protein